MVIVNPVIETWIISFISVVLLTVQWIAMFLGLLGCCGFGLKLANTARFSGNHHHQNSPTRVNTGILSLTRESSSALPVSMSLRVTPRQSIAISLFFSVTCSWICAICIFMRKFIRFPDDVTLPQAICEFYCRMSLLFYGIAKLVIYAMIYFKVLKLIDAGPPEEERVVLFRKRFLRFVVGFGLLGFSVCVLSGVSRNECYRTSGACTCITPADAAIPMMVLDWIVSATLLGYFCYPVIRQIMNPESQAKELWKTVAMHQLRLALAVLLVSPCMVAIFIYLDVAVPANQRKFTATAFLTTDLMICCYAQGFAALKIWTRRSNCCGFQLPNPMETDAASKRGSKNENSVSKKNQHHQKNISFGNFEANISMNPRMTEGSSSADIRALAVTGPRRASNSNSGGGGGRLPITHLASRQSPALDFERKILPPLPPTPDEPSFFLQPQTTASSRRPIHSEPVMKAEAAATKAPIFFTTTGQLSPATNAITGSAPPIPLIMRKALPPAPPIHDTAATTGGGGGDTFIGERVTLALESKTTTVTEDVVFKRKVQSSSVIAAPDDDVEPPIPDRSCVSMAVPKAREM